MAGKSSRERGYYGPSDLDLTVGALSALAILLLAAVAAASLACSGGLTG